MNLHKPFSIFVFVSLLMASLIGVITSTAQDNISIPQVMDLMSNAHMQYSQIHVRYAVEAGGMTRQHEVWLNASSGSFRYEVSGITGIEQLHVSDGSYIYENPSPTGIPITLKALPNNNSEIPFANRMLGGIGTLISPIFAVENRLGASEITVDGVELFTAENLPEPMDVIKLHTLIPGFYPTELWVSLDTGIIVKEVIYGSNDSIFSTTTLEFLEINPRIDPSIFAVDANQYNLDQLREIFPPPPVNE